MQEVAVQNKIAPENLEYAGDMKGMNDEPIAHLFNVTDENDPGSSTPWRGRFPPGRAPLCRPSLSRKPLPLPSSSPRTCSRRLLVRLSRKVRRAGEVP